MMSADVRASRSGRAGPPTGPENRPRNNVERQVHGIWANVLGRSDFGVLDGFFSLGGSSLDAMRVLAAIGRDFGRTLSVGSFFRSPTIAASCLLLRVSPEAGSWNSLVPIRTEGSKPPLFCVHPLDGTTIRFFELARALPADQPVYGLQSPGLVDPDWSPQGMRDIAQACFDDIRQLSAAVPVQLVGHAFGGILAFEIAQLVAGSTGHYPLVALIDAPTTLVGGDEATDERSAIEHLVEAAHLDPSAASGIGDREAAVRETYARGVRNVVSERDLPPAKWRGLLNVLDTNLAALRSYKPQPYPGDIVVFSNEKNTPAPDLGWNSHARRTVTYSLSPGHNPALEGEDLRHAATALTRLLAEEEEESA
jgi:thioesterase domain-containing protein